MEIDRNIYLDAQKISLKSNTEKTKNKNKDNNTDNTGNSEKQENSDISAEYIPTEIESEKREKSTGCIGMKKKPFKKIKNKITNQQQPIMKKPPSEPYKYLVPVREKSGKPYGCELLWQPEVVTLDIYLITNSSNPITLEACVATIHNLCGCDWNVSGHLCCMIW